jgi:hypothetical protein
VMHARGVGAVVGIARGCSGRACRPPRFARATTEIVCAESASAPAGFVCAHSRGCMAGFVSGQASARARPGSCVRRREIVRAKMRIGGSPVRFAARWRREGPGWRVPCGRAGVRSVDAIGRGEAGPNRGRAPEL